MNELLTQTIMAVRDTDEDAGWMQLLVFIVLAVIYALGSILKTKAKKFEEEEQSQPPSRKPGLKPADRIQPREPRRQVDSLRAQIARPQLAARKLAAKLEKQLFPPVTQPKLKEPKVPLVKPPKLLEVQPVVPFAVSLEEPQPEPEVQLLFDFDDPDVLRKAILHYEILGKPISLREP